MRSCPCGLQDGCIPHNVCCTAPVPGLAAHLVALTGRDRGLNKPLIGPLLVVCFTNHALDSFLEALLDVGIEDIIRVGGKSKSARVEPYNLISMANQHRVRRHAHSNCFRPPWMRD